MVESVLDGDTVEVTTRGGKTARVRFLGIKHQRSRIRGSRGECYGYRSSKHLKKLLPPGSNVMLVSDPRQASLDTYERLLRYVQVDGRDVGRAQVRAGAAAARDSSDQASRYAARKKLEGDAEASDVVEALRNHLPRLEALGSWKSMPNPGKHTRSRLTPCDRRDTRMRAL